MWIIRVYRSIITWLNLAVDPVDPSVRPRVAGSIRCTRVIQCIVAMAVAAWVSVHRPSTKQSLGTCDINWRAEFATTDVGPRFLREPLRVGHNRTSGVHVHTRPSKSSAIVEFRAAPFDIALNRSGHVNQSVGITQDFCANSGESRTRLLRHRPSMKPGVDCVAIQ